jgi:hypothetical protein
MHFTCIRRHRHPAKAHVYVATPLPLSRPHNHVSPGTSATTASTTKVSISRRSLPKPCQLATMGLALPSHPSLDLTGWVRAVGCRRGRTTGRSLSLHHHRRIEASTCRWLCAAARHHGSDSRMPPPGRGLSTVGTAWTLPNREREGLTRWEVSVPMYRLTKEHRGREP